MEVHRPLGLPRGARRERDQRDVVRRRAHGVEVARLLSHRGLETVARIGLEAHHALEHRGLRRRLLELAGDTLVGERHRHLRLVDDELELARAEEGHRRHHHAPRLEHGEPARREHRRVRAAQEHAVPRHDPQLVNEHVGDPVRLLRELGVRPAPARKADCHALAASLAHVPVEQRVHAVELLGVRQLGEHAVVHGRPELARREMVAREAVDVGGSHQDAPSVPVTKSV